VNEFFIEDRDHPGVFEGVLIDAGKGFGSFPHPKTSAAPPGPSYGCPFFSDGPDDRRNAERRPFQLITGKYER